MVAITHPSSFAPTASWPTAARRPSAAVYRRRRLAVAGLLLVLLALASVAGQLLASRSGAEAGDLRPIARVSVTVAPGDTVWSIASELAPGHDPRPVVDAIVEANGGSSLVAGQRLDLVLP